MGCYCPASNGANACSAGACSADVYDALVSAGASARGLDVAAGLAHSGGNAEAYAGILRRFCAELDRREAEISRCLSAPDWKAYSAKLHAMRGLFATIGAGELSAAAARLEAAARGGDAETCRGETAAFCESMRGLGDFLRGTQAAPPRSPAPKTLASPAAIAGKLAELKCACLEGDSDAADAACAHLATLSLGESSRESDEALSEICSFADSLDYGAAAAKIDDFLQGKHLLNPMGI